MLTLEKEIAHLWWLGTSLTQALAARDRLRADELIEAIVIHADLTEHAPVRAKALKLLSYANRIGPADVVAFGVAEATVSAAGS